MVKHRGLRLAAAVILLTGAMGVVAMASGGAEPSAVHLHLGSDGRYFRFGTTTQTLTTATNSCAVSSPQPVMNLTSTGTAASPGLGSDSLGVKSKSGANGTPCGQVDSTESLVLKPARV